MPGDRTPGRCTGSRSLKNPNRRTPVDTTPSTLMEPARNILRVLNDQLSWVGPNRSTEKTVMRAAWRVTGGLVAAGVMLAPEGIATADPVHRATPTRRSGRWRRPATTSDIDRVGRCTDRSVHRHQRAEPAGHHPHDSGGQRQQEGERGLRLRRSRGPPDDHRLAQLRRAGSPSGLVVLIVFLFGHRRVGGLVGRYGLGRNPVNALTIRFNGSSPLERV